MKLRWLPFLLLVLPGVVRAQAPEKDSLRAVIRAHPRDTGTIETYYQYGLLLEGDNLDSAAAAYNRGLALARATGHVRGQIHYASYISDVYNVRGELTTSRAEHRRALRLARRHRLPLEEAKILFNIGNVFNYEGRYDSAVTYYQQAATRFERLGNQRFRQILYQNLGVVFDELKQYRQAIAYADKAIALSLTRGDSLTLVSVLVNRAGSLSSLHQYDAALADAQRARIICRRRGDSYNEYVADLNIGNILTHQHHYPAAAAAFSEALRLARQMDYDPGVPLGGLAMAAFEAGDYRTADRYQSEALTVLDKSAVAPDRIRVYKLAADIKAHLGQYAPAYQFLLRYTTLNDSLTGADVKKRVQELEAKYESARKDRALLDQQLQLARGEAAARRRQIWLAGVVALAALLAGALVLARRAAQRRQQAQAERIRTLEREAEVIQLKATLAGQQEERQRIAKEMHDEIGSGLTSILYLSAATADADRSARIGTTAQRLVSQMNEIVWSLSAGQDSLEELVAYLRHNLSELLESVDLDYDFCIPDPVPTVAVGGPQRRNLYLAVKEAVHNAIKHAGATCVTIELAFTDGLTVTVRDDGRGLPPGGGRRFGNGLKNMRHRLEAIGGTFRLVSEQPVALAFHVPADRLV